MKALVDASVIMPVLIDEPEKNNIIVAVKDCELMAPIIMPYEIGNALSNLKKRQTLNHRQIISVYNEYLKIPLRLLDVNIENALLIACKYNIYAYDAYYLELASRLNLPLLTLDNPMKKIAIDLKLKIIEVKNESI